MIQNIEMGPFGRVITERIKEVVKTRRKLSTSRDLVSEGRFLLTRLKEIVAPSVRYHSEVNFVDFKASSKPDITPPKCLACEYSLYWHPDSYSLNGYKIPEIGWWKCPKGHPGEVYLPDFNRYVEAAIWYQKTFLGIDAKGIPLM